MLLVTTSTDEPAQFKSRPLNFEVRVALIHALVVESWHVLRTLLDDRAALHDPDHIVPVVTHNEITQQLNWPGKDNLPLVGVVDRKSVV